MESGMTNPEDLHARFAPVYEAGEEAVREEREAAEAATAEREGAREELKRIEAEILELMSKLTEAGGSLEDMGADAPDDISPERKVIVERLRELADRKMELGEKTGDKSA